MKRLSFLIVAITTVLLLLQSGVSGEEIKPIYISPRPNSVLVQAETVITFRFAEDVEGRSLTDTLMQVTGNKSGNHKGTAILTGDKRTVIFKPDEPFMPAETVNMTLNPGLLSTTGSKLFSESFDFTISPQTLKRLSQAAPFLAGDGMGIGAKTNILSFAGGSSNSYVTAPLNFPEMTISVPANGTANGYIFLSNFTVDWSNGNISKSQPFLLILDNEGEPVFYKSMRQGQPTMDFKKQPNGLLTYGEWGAGIFYGMDSSYNIVKTYQAGNGYSIDIHDLQILPNEHALIIIYDGQQVDMSAYGGKIDAIVIGLVIQELDVDGNVVFQWRSWDYLDDDNIPFTDSTVDLTQAIVDYIHGNAVELDYDGNLLISSRNLDEITKIDRQTGDIIWRLGGKKNEFTFVGDPEPFFKQHDIRRVADGFITIFDNRSGPESTFARAVEYQLDVPNKIATRVWEHRNNGMSPAMGNAQRLPNGNTMIGWGSVYPSLTEVKSNGEIAFELSFVPLDSPNLMRNSYRAFRFEWEGKPTSKPLLVAKNDIPGVTSLYISWNGATNVSSYGVYGGETPDSMMFHKTQEKDGFETEILIADAEEELCYFQVMPLDKDGKETRFSNLALAEHCIESQAYIPVIAETTVDN